MGRAAGFAVEAGAGAQLGGEQVSVGEKCNDPPVLWDRAGVPPPGLDGLHCGRGVAVGVRSRIGGEHGDQSVAGDPSGAAVPGVLGAPSGGVDDHRRHDGFVAIEERPQGYPGGLGRVQQAGVERHAVEVPPSAEGVEHEVRAEQVAAAPGGPVAEAAEVVAGYERAGPEDVVDDSVESGWRTLADAERTVGSTIDDEAHGATGAREGGGGGASRRAAADHDGVVTGPPSHTIGSICCHLAFQVLVGSLSNPTFVSTSMTAGNASSVGPGCSVTSPNSPQCSTMLRSVSGRAEATTKRCQSYRRANAA